MPTAVSRRAFIAAGASACALAALPRAARAADGARPALARVILDNDFAGDPDGLFQLAHHVLCTSVEIPLIVGTHLPANTPWPTSDHQATDAANEVRRLLRLMKRPQAVVAGAETGLASRAEWQASPATAAIVREAMREDTTVPLFYAAGAGLTELALAWLAEPRIGRRLKLVWIGGNEHPGLAYPPPGPPQPEFNFTIDPIAAQILFNESDIEIWQVPRDGYRQMLFATSELRDLGRTGALGRYLVGKLESLNALLAKLQFPRTETYVLGDSPLVTLTALQAPFEPDAASSRYVLQPTPRLTAQGGYEARSDGRPMRVYTSIDAGLTFRDMTSKFREFSRGARR